MIERNPTIDSKYIFYFLYKDPEGRLNTIILSHGMNIIGVKSVQVQNLKAKKHRYKLGQR